jgi:MFS family permease
LANAAISAVGCSITAMAFPLMLYAQGVHGLSPTGAALLLTPMAVLSGALAPVVGRLTDRLHPRGLTTFGLATTSGALFWLAAVMGPDAETWQLLLPMTLMGIGSPFVWAPLSATATRNLPMSAAGAGSGVYNTTRQVGAVLGSAAIAVLMEARLRTNLPGLPTGGAAMRRAGDSMPPAIKEGFASAMAEAMLLPAAVLLVGVFAALFFERPQHQRA